MDNYFNPGSVKPNNGYQPDGALGGLYSAQDRQMYQQSMGLQQQMAEQELQRQQMANQYFQNATLDPSKAEGRAKESGFGLTDLLNKAKTDEPGYGPTMARGEMGHANSQYAQGEVDRQTIDPKVQDARAESMLKQWQAGAQQLEYMYASNPDGGQAVYQQWLASLPKDIRDRMGPTYNKEHVDKFILGAQNHIAERRKLAEEQLKATSQERIGAGHDAATRYAADQRVTAAYSKLSVDGRRKLENKQVEMLDVLMDPKATPEQKAQAKEMLDYLNTYMYGLSAARTSGLVDPNRVKADLVAPGTQGRPAPTPPQVPVPGGAPQPQAQGAPQEIQAQLQQAGWAYEPDKYEYGINPATNKFARKPKRK